MGANSFVLPLCVTCNLLKPVKQQYPTTCEQYLEGTKVVSPPKVLYAFGRLSLAERYAFTQYSEANANE